MTIQKYEPEEIHPVPVQNADQMYELIHRQQEIQRQQQAIAFMQLMNQQQPTIQGTYQPEKHQVEKRSPHWLITAQNHINLATWFLVVCFALMLLHLATYRSLHPENTTYPTQEIN